jgi:hypothetical protein
VYWEDIKYKGEGRKKKILFSKNVSFFLKKQNKTKQQRRKKRKKICIGIDPFLNKKSFFQMPLALSLV